MQYFNNLYCIFCRIFKTTFPQDATENTVSITDTLQHTMLLADIKKTRLIITGLKPILKVDFKDKLKTNLDTREVGAVGFVQSNLIFPKLGGMMQQQTDQLDKIRNGSAIVLNGLVNASPPPADHDIGNNFVMIVEEDADKMITNNIVKITTEKIDNLRQTEANTQI